MRHVSLISLGLAAALTPAAAHAAPEGFFLAIGGGASAADTGFWTSAQEITVSGTFGGVSESVRLGEANDTLKRQSLDLAAGWGMRTGRVYVGAGAGYAFTLGETFDRGALTGAGASYSSPFRPQPAPIGLGDPPPGAVRSIRPDGSWSARLTAGYVLRNDVLLYAGAGYSELNADIEVRDAVTGTAADRVVVDASTTLSGLAGFAGAEIPLRAHWSVRIEAGYGTYDGVRFSAGEEFPDGAPEVWNREARFGTLETITGRLQLVYRFGR